MTLRRPSLRSLALLFVCASPLLADNCGSLNDCYSTLRAALAALVGISALAAISLMLDLTPGVGTLKGIIQMITGKDILTGEQLDIIDRLLGVIPGGRIGREARALEKEAQELKRLEKLAEEEAFALKKAGIPEELTELRASARTPLENEDILLSREQGLQTRTEGRFDQVVTGSHGDPETKYLWTVDKRGINIALEKTPFATPRGNIVHTNLSPEASIGGEVWFTSKNEVIINAGSGRFGAGLGGASKTQWQAAIAYWEKLGYKVTSVPLGKR